MAIVRVARHGETTWNVEGRYQGRMESSLSARGVLQANALAHAVRDTATKRVICSPLQRTRVSASAAAALLNCEFEVDDRLIEIGHGTWEGRLRDELERNDAARYRAWRDHPESVSFENGESMLQVHERWEQFSRSFQDSAETLIITHDAIVRVAILAGSSRPLSDFWKARVTNGAYAQFWVEDGRWHLERECVEAHLAGLQSDAQAQAL
ncbi:MAG: histidine phosphatase family protein [Candidatus Eremiobacteraeota bacterium]|nr:histidine phosphatase family protein [Candidatus Eremiobacteraeota bacterium]